MTHARRALMTKPSISVHELDSVAGELFQLMPAAILESAVALRLRCEIGDGHGTTELYVVGKDGHARHILYQQGLLRTVFDRLYELPCRVQETDRPWTLAVLRWELGGTANLSLIDAPEPDGTMTAERRDEWEKSEFPGRIVEHLETAFDKYKNGIWH
jgi:hypothetical protein